MSCWTTTIGVALGGRHAIRDGPRICNGEAET